MRRTGLVLICGVLLVTAVLGCRTREPNLKPAVEPEVLALPPEGDPRFSQPYIPKEVMKNRSNPFQQPLGQPQGRPTGAFGPSGIGGGSSSRGF